PRHGKCSCGRSFAPSPSASTRKTRRSRPCSDRARSPAPRFERASRCGSMRRRRRRGRSSLLLDIHRKPFPHLHDHALAVLGGEEAAEVIRLDGVLTVTAIDEHGQLDGARPAVLYEGIQGGTSGAPGEEHVVHQHDVAVRDVAGDGRLVRRTLASIGRIEVVAEGGDVELLDIDVTMLDTPDFGGDGGGDGASTAADSDDLDILGAAVALDDLEGDALQDPPDTIGREDLPAGRVDRHRSVSVKLTFTTQPAASTQQAASSYWNIALMLPHVRRTAVGV